MNLSDFATPLAAKNNFIKASFGGFAGSGKTRTMTEFTIGAYKDLGCKKPILIIDNEKGSRFLIPHFQKAGIETLVKDTLELADVLKAFEYLNNGDIDFLFIDSLTKIWYKYVRDYKKKNRRTFMTLQDWGKILPAWQEEFADKFVELSGNCVFTGRGGYTYDMEENDETGKKEFAKSGVKMKMAGETPFEPDLNVWMDVQQTMDEGGKPKIWREALVMKDRSALIDGKTFKNPTYKAFQPVVKYLLDAPKGEVAGSTDTTNLAPHEEYNSRKAKRDQLAEEIKGQFDLMGMGTGKEEKKIKAHLCKAIFSTTSMSAIEKMDLAGLETGVNRLKQITEKINHYAKEGNSVTMETVEEFLAELFK